MIFLIKLYFGTVQNPTILAIVDAAKVLPEPVPYHIRSPFGSPDILDFILSNITLSADLWYTCKLDGTIHCPPYLLVTFS